MRYYGQWMRDEAEKRIGRLYPKAKVTAEMAKDRPDLKPYVGRELTVIAWLWARTVESSNPAYRGCHVPLVSSFWLSTKPGKEAWIEVEKGTTNGHEWTRMEGGKEYRFVVKTPGSAPGSAGVPPADKDAISSGTKLGRGANFRCVLSQSPLSPDYIRAEAQAGRMHSRLMAIVCEGDRGRVYLPPIPEHEEIARQAKPAWKPDQKVTTPCHDVDRLPMYGMYTWGDAFTPRQLTALTTFSDLVAEAREKILEDFQSLEHSAGDSSNPWKKEDYAAAVSVYLAFAIDKMANYGSTLCSWHSARDGVTSTFGRQALPMVWDFTEANPLSDSSGNFLLGVDQCRRSLDAAPALEGGKAYQADAARIDANDAEVISTDPPYYDNIGYADLSDFFYVWMRKSLQALYPELFGTLLVPKAEELVATPYRHGSKDKAEAFFLDGMTKAVHSMSERTHPAFPVTIYYAFKQAEGDAEGTASTGWETFLDAVIRAGFAITGTWPMRTEYVGNLKKNVSALASSIVLVCRPRPADASQTTRKDFLAALRRELPPALRHLQEGNIAPVDLAQASIGPGMAVFSRYSRILETDGKPMTVRTALQLINQTLDETLAEQEGDFDPETAWAVAWFEQFGFNDGPFGDAETLSKAKNTALNALTDAGIVKAGGGKVRLQKPGSAAVSAASLANHPTVWMLTHLLVHALETGGETAAAELLMKAGETPALPGSDTARELAYRLYAVCERKKRAAEALSYNALVQSWPEITRLAREAAAKPKAPVQGELL